MALRKVKGNFERLFDKNQSDLVRGIRNNKDNEHKYITQCIEEIKEELKQDNLSIKANAIAKLNYLQMLGYDISWAAFNVIEVMSSTKFTHKRIGYLCASQCFHESMDVMMLTTNMIRKDLHSQSMYDAGLALSGLACFVNADIARDLANDVLMQLNSTKPYLRKKAVLTLYKIFLKYPDALKIAFPRLKEKLEDPDPGVQSAAVNVICELARKNPKNYLCLAPIFFKLMQNSTNNWMLIKIIKLFGALTPLEPRLGKKLIAPLTNLIHSTSAMSLLYECINTVIAVLISISSGLPDHNSSIQLCVQKLRILIEDTDQNLKYLGLLAMSRILKTHPKSVQSHKDLVLTCLEDKDESIRLRALDLIIGMISKKNLIEIIHKLMQSVKNNSLGNKYRDELIFKIIEICSQNDYAFISNFEWYISVLVDLSQVEGGTVHANLIARQLFDVTIRVESITQFSTNQMSIMIENAGVFTDFCDVLYAAAFICGEFAHYLTDKRKVCLDLLSKNFDFPPYIQATFLQNSLKIFVKLIETEQVGNLDALCDELNQLLKSYLFSDDFEVQERAATFQQILSFVRDKSVYNLEVSNNISSLPTPTNQNDDKSYLNDDNVMNSDVKLDEPQPQQLNDIDSNDEERLSNLQEDLINLPKEESLVKNLSSLEGNSEFNHQDEIGLFKLEPILYGYSIKPVAAKAQKKVPIPAELDLDQPFRELQYSSDEEFRKGTFQSDDEDLFIKNTESDDELDNKKKKKRKKHKKEKSKKDKHHKNDKFDDKEVNKLEDNYENNMMYLQPRTKKSKDENILNEKTEEAVEAVEGLVEISNIRMIPGLVSSDKYFQESKKSSSDKKTKKNKKRTKSSKEEKDDQKPEQSELVAENKIKILSLEMPEGADDDLNNDLDDEIVDDESDPHKALAQIKFDEFIQQEKALKSNNELSLKEKSSNSRSKSLLKEDENGIVKKSKKTKKKTKDDETTNKKSKKVKKEKHKDELTKTTIEHPKNEKSNEQEIVT